MKRFAALSAIALLAVLPACESFRLFNDYRVVESPDVATAPWPRLVDTPETPPPGTFTEDIPDPAVGVAVQSALSDGARQAGPRADALAAPVIDPAGRARLEAGEATARARGPSGPLLGPSDARRFAEAEANREARRAAEAE